MSARIENIVNIVSVHPSAMEHTGDGYSVEGGIVLLRLEKNEKENNINTSFQSELTLS